MNYTPTEDLPPADEVVALLVAGKYDEAITALVGRGSDISEEIPTLYNAVLRLKPKIVIEAGTRNGESTMALLAALEQTGGGYGCDEV